MNNKVLLSPGKFQGFQKFYVRNPGQRPEKFIIRQGLVTQNQMQSGKAILYIDSLFWPKCTVFLWMA